ncbi:MAG: Gfo/Idh/MocA family oxidoreductase [Planctomycetes bacterium]|nr:Gfo/Idh/MocA family oxidoreductase [Planctomycetota bacterium]
MAEQINIGIVGACGRGKSFRTACEAHPSLNIHAVCDMNTEKLDEAKANLGADEKYLDYDEMLEKSDIQAVIVATPMHFHVPMSIAALKRGLHVLSEVPAAVSIEESKELVRACKESDGVYMMAENACYMRHNAIVRELVRKGLFGETFYAEGEYLHELKELNEVTTWRRKWQTGINGITYGTHSLGPILQWMPGDRVVSVSCAGSGRHYKDPRGNIYENEDSCVMLCKMAKGGLVKIRVDMISDRPHGMNCYSLQGVDGCFESSRGFGERHKIWLRCLSEKPEWHDLTELEKEHLPEYWRTASETAKKAGHGGGDYFEIMDFCDAITGKTPCPIGIHEAMDMTLPELVSQNSIQQDGAWLPVPDSREW